MDHRKKTLESVNSQLASWDKALMAQQYVLHYQSRRSDIWKWYWRKWRRILWVIHLIIAAGIAFLAANRLYGEATPVQYALTLAWILALVVLCSASFPQVMFKSGERWLEISPQGWSTRIGNKSGSKTWSEIKKIHQQKGFLLITSISGNALIVPERALQNNASWEAFVHDVFAWHKAYVQ